MSTPWTIEVDGVVLPKQLSGHPALELCNSRAGWQETPAWEGEYLRSYDALALLALTAGVLPQADVVALRKKSAGDPDGVAAVLDRARALRGDLYATFTGEPGRAARRRLSDAVEHARARQHLVLEPHSAHWEFAGPRTLEDPLDAFLLSAGSLLTDDARELVAACPGEDCGWLFLNTSRRRKWCQMAVCGNRAKQAAFAGRQRTEGG
ncbi:CGNR zinc finger domain-containing protein [Flexivirga sp. B27]